MIENNIASNTQIGGISIWNNWVCKYYPNPKDKSRYDIVYIKDSGVAKDFPETEINNKKVPKKVKVYKDKDFTVPYFLTEEVEYLPDYFETIKYDKFYTDENYNNNDSYNRAGNFIEDLVADNLLVFCTRWLHLAGFKEFLEDWDEYNKKFLKSYSRHGNYGRFNYILDEHRVVETPFLDMGDIKAENPFYECRAEKPILLLKPLKDSEVDLNEYNESDFHGYSGNQQLYS